MGLFEDVPTNEGVKPVDDNNVAPTPLLEEQSAQTTLTPHEAAVERAKAAFLRIAQGVGPEAPKTVNALGGAQSVKKWQFRLFDPGAMYVLGRVLDRGASEYGPDNWRLIETSSHLNAVMMHVLAFLGGDRSDDHLGHGFCRMMFALGVELADNPAYDYRQGDERGTVHTDPTGEVLQAHSPTNA